MILKIHFNGSNEPFKTVYLNKQVNGFVNKLLGDASGEYHGKMSDYSVSCIQGWNREGDSFFFKNGAVVVISSPNVKFIGKLVEGILMKRASNIMGLKYSHYEVGTFDVHKKFDLIRTSSPLRVSGKNRTMLTFDDDEFLDVLNKKSVSKLIAAGVDEKDANSVKIDFFHKEGAKKFYVKIGSSVHLCTKAMFVVSGSKNARTALYEMGLGNATGFGFGSVSINK